MTELTKPPVLAARGGCWFRGGGWEVHVSPVPGFVPERKAHPGVLVHGLDLLAAGLEAACASGVGCAKTLGCVTTRKNPLRTMSEMPYGCSPRTFSRSQSRYSA